MPTFAFTARDGTGRPQAGQLAATDVPALVNELRTRGWLVLEVRPPAERSSSPRFNLAPSAWLPTTSFDVELGLQQIAIMLRSGLTLLVALRTAAEQARRPRMAAVWLAVHADIEHGATFAEALARHRRFAPFVVQLVRAGEQSGTLDTVLTQAAAQVERARSLRTMLLTALLYPAIVVLMAIGVTAFMLFSLIPKLQKFLLSRGRGLPAITQALLDVSSWLQGHLPHLLIGGLAVLAGVMALRRWPPGRLATDRALLRLPIVGRLLRQAGTAAVARTLGLLLANGITLLSALPTAANLLVNRALRGGVERARADVLAGAPLAPALSEPGLFMPMLGRMAAVGEATGVLDDLLGECARFHEAQLAADLKRLSTLIEPAIIVVVGGVVGFVYLAFFMALFSMAGAVR